MNLFCPVCGKDRVVLLSWQAKRLRADCAHCGTYITDLRQNPEHVALAPHRSKDQPLEKQDGQQLALLNVPAKSRGSWERERAKSGAERR